MAIAFPPARSISLTADAAAAAPFVYVMATFAPSAARRLAIAAPMPREPPVISAIFPSSFLNIVLLPYARSPLQMSWATCRRIFEEYFVSRTAMLPEHGSGKMEPARRLHTSRLPPKVPGLPLRVLVG